MLILPELSEASSPESSVFFIARDSGESAIRCWLTANPRLVSLRIRHMGEKGPNYAVIMLDALKGQLCSKLLPLIFFLSSHTGESAIRCGLTARAPGSFPFGNS